jgi:hypothetical protein
MSDRDWEHFFELLKRIVDLPNMTWEEKADKVDDEAARYDAETALEEFTGWWQ